MPTPKRDLLVRPGIEMSDEQIRQMDHWTPANDWPNKVMNDLHRRLWSELFDVSQDTGVEMMMLHEDTKKAIWRVLERQVELAEKLFEGDCYPDRLSDKDLLILSYKLPTPIALALLRKRLIRGLALRDMHVARANRTLEPIDINL